MNPAARAIADRQLHVITARQLLEAGLSRSQIQRRLTGGELRTIFRGAYLTAGAYPTFEQKAVAACLVSGKGAFVSHRAAAKLWDLLSLEPIEVDVTITADRRVRIAGIRAHRTSAVSPSDKGTRDPIPIASPARTLLGLAGEMTYDELEPLGDDAIRRRLTTPRALFTYLQRPDLALAPGIARLRKFARVRLVDGVRESDLEDLLLPVLRRYRFPLPVTQYKRTVSGRSVRFDYAYPDERIAIEFDGEAPHWGRDRWQTGHDRHNATELSEWRVLRFTWWDIKKRPLYVVLTIASALGLRPRGWTAVRRSRSTEAAHR